MLCAVTSTFGEREQKQARQSTFFLLSVADSFSKSYILYCNKFEKDAQICVKVHEKVVKWLVIQNFDKAEHIWTVYLELKAFHNIVMIKLIFFEWKLHMNQEKITISSFLIKLVHLVLEKKGKTL